MEDYGRAGRMRLVAVVLLFLFFGGGFVYKSGFWKPRSQPRVQTATRVPATTQTAAVEPDMLRKDAKSFLIGIDTWVGSMPLYLIKAQEFDKQLDFNLEIAMLPDDVDRAEQLAKGTLDASLMTVDAWVKHQGTFGTVGTAIFKGDDSYGADMLIVNATRIKTLNDLGQISPSSPRRAVAFVQDSASEYFLLYLLRTVGLSRQDVTLKPVADIEEAIRMFRTDQVDAMVAWEPEASQQVLKIPNAKTLISSKEAVNLIADVALVSKAAQEKRPADIDKFTRAWFMAVKMLIEQPDRAHEILARTLPEDHGHPSVSELASMFKGIRLTSIEANQAYMGATGQGEIANMIATADKVYREAGKMTAQLNPSSMIDKAVVVKAMDDTRTRLSTLDPAVTGLKTQEPLAPKDLAKLDKSQVDTATQEIAKLKVDRLYFDADSTKLSPNAYPILDEVAATLRNFPQYYLVIEGHVNGMDTPENQAFSLARAQSVVDYLLTKGFGPNRLIAQGFGGKKPVSQTDPELNRRTEFRLVQSKDLR